MESVAGVIVAGGAGSRLGGSKPWLTFGDGTLLDAVIARVKPQVTNLALNLADADARKAHERHGMAHPILLDPFGARAGPLGGVLAGLEWLEATKSAAWLASFPGDTPFLPEDLVAQLAAAASTRSPIGAATEQRVHALCALWPVECAQPLRAGLVEGRLRSVMSAIEAFGGRTQLIAADPEAFLNINTAEDLARGEAIRQARNIP